MPQGATVTDSERGRRFILREVEAGPTGPAASSLERFLGRMRVEVTVFQGQVHIDRPNQKIDEGNPILQIAAGRMDAPLRCADRIGWKGGKSDGPE